MNKLKAFVKQVLFELSINYNPHMSKKGAEFIRNKNKTHE